MRAVQYTSFGGPEVLGVAASAEPHAGPGQIRIQVRAAGVNPFDCKMRAGMFGGDGFPRTPGLEAAGVVDEVGVGVSGVAVGDAVFGLGPQTNAEFAVLNHFAPKPEALDWAEAAAVSATAEAAVRSLELLGLRPGQTLVIDGVAGGVGRAAAQLALAEGVTVIGTSREANHDALRSLGVHPTTYGPGLAERVKSLAAQVGSERVRSGRVGSGRVDGALDTAGKGSIADLAALTGDPARVVTIADFSGAVPGVQVTSKTSAFHALARAAELINAGKYTVAVDSVYPLESAAQAHARCEQGGLAGKVVLNP